MSVSEILQAILALSSQDQQRLASHLFDRREPGAVALAHVIVARSVRDEMPSDEVNFTLELS